MELGAIMEFRVRRGSQLEEEDTPYIVNRQIQPLSTNQPATYDTTAKDKRYYRKGSRYYHGGPPYYRCYGRS